VVDCEPVVSVWHDAGSSVCPCGRIRRFDTSHTSLLSSKHPVPIHGPRKFNRPINETYCAIVNRTNTAQLVRVDTPATQLSNCHILLGTPDNETDMFPTSVTWQCFSSLLLPVLKLGPWYECVWLRHWHFKNIRGTSSQGCYPLRTDSLGAIVSIAGGPHCACARPLHPRPGVILRFSVEAVRVFVRKYT
jgi:hypothetical protein